MSITKPRVFLILSLSFIGGIGTASFYYPKSIDSFYLFVFLVLSLIILAVFYKEKRMALFCFAVLFFISGVYLINIKLEKLNNLDMAGKKFEGIVEIVKEPEIKSSYQGIIVRPMQLGHPMSKFLINTSKYGDYKYGDNLKVSCNLEIIKNFSEQSADSSFDYQMYLAKDGIFYECKNAKIENLKNNAGNKFYSTILKIKNKFNDNVMRLMPSPQSGLLSGLLIGGDDFLSKSYQDNFSNTGMTHIVAVSGYNVTIVAEYLMILGIFLGLWRKQAFWFAVAGIIFFVILTGMASSAVRAGVMGVLLIWAMKNGRLANCQNAIVFSAGVMLLFNPLLLRWDIGFQLSFLATLGIVYVYPIFNEYFLRFVETRHCLVSTSAILEILLLTIAAQIFVLPVILFNFNKLSLISPLANILILPIIPLTMLLGFVAVTLSFIFYPIAQVFAWMAFLPLKYETLVIDYLASLKYASVEVAIPWWVAAVWYIILAGIVYKLKKA